MSHTPIGYARSRDIDVRINGNSKVCLRRPCAGDANCRDKFERVNVSRRNFVAVAIVCVSSLTAGCGGASSRPSSGDLADAPCPDGIGFCGVFVSNDCAGSTCAHRPLVGLDSIVLMPLDGGVPSGAAEIVVEPRADGVFFTPLTPGTYHVRPNGDRFRGFIVHVGTAPVLVDCRSTMRASSRLVGHVHISVGGGADGNTSISSGGPGRFVVVSIRKLVGEQQFDGSPPLFAIADADGRFELALPPGRYYVSDIIQANEDGGPRVFASSINPVSGQAVEITDGETTSVEVAAHEMAP